MIPTSKKTAKAEGSKHYFTGSPCARGHVARRFTSTGACVECLAGHKKANADRYAEKNREYARRYYRENIEEVRAARLADYYAKREAYQARSLDWHARNKERAQQLRARFVENNPEYFANYRKEHKTERLADSSARRSAKRRAVPAWYGEFDELVMIEAFELAALRERSTGFPWHVDHQIPLRARNAHGLHVGLNMQVIPALMNLSKGNKMVLTEVGEWLSRM